MKDTITSRGVSFRRPVADEKTEQGSIVNLVEVLGGQAYVLGSRRAQYCGLCGARTTDQGTRQTEGISDVAIYLPPPGRRPGRWVFLWIEVKGRTGTLSPEQVAFRDITLKAGVPHLVGGLDEFHAWLVAGGWVRA